MEIMGGAPGIPEARIFAPGVPEARIFAPGVPGERTFASADVCIGYSSSSLCGGTCATAGGSIAATCAVFIGTTR
jgi:hypothetical protein